MAQTCSYYIGSKDERTISHPDKSIKVDCTANHIFEVTQWVIGVSKWKVEIRKGVSKVQSCNIKKSRLEVFELKNHTVILEYFNIKESALFNFALQSF